MKDLNELPGSKCGGAMTEIAPSITKRIMKFFRRNSPQHKKLEITNHAGGTINLWLVENTKEEIAQLILECKGNINKKVSFRAKSLQVSNFLATFADET